jgi:hypothetical protein
VGHGVAVTETPPRVALPASFRDRRAAGGTPTTGFNRAIGVCHRTVTSRSPAACGRAAGAPELHLSGARKRHFARAPAAMDVTRMRILLRRSKAEEPRRSARRGSSCRCGDSDQSAAAASSDSGAPG